jgi:uncharacterized protein
LNRRITALLISFGCLVTMPVAAQQMSQSFNFLKAVRDRDANAAQTIVSDPSATAVNARDDSGQGALHIIVLRRDDEWLNWLLGHRARPDIQDGDGNTPLALAAQIGWLEGAARLLARGASVDLANRRGETPLIMAVHARQLSTPDQLAMVRLLLGHGADPRHQDSYAGLSALDYARRDSRVPEVVRLLEQGAQPRPEVIGPSPN